MRTLFYIITLLIFSMAGFTQTSKLGGYAANGQYIGFLQFLPEGYASGSTKFPLIISLHGQGEKGNGTTQLNNVECCGIPQYIKTGNKMRFTWNGKTESFIVLSPQLNPKYSRWQNFYVDELVKYALRSLRVDPDRIFLTGLSLGGGGVWTYSSTSLVNARQFAGLIPVVAPCFLKEGCIIAKSGVPVFALHAMNDTVAPAQCTINAIRMINNCNPLTTPNVILYPSGGHVVFFNKTYDTAHRYQDPNVFEWMLAQNRKLAPNKKPVARLTAGSSITNGQGLITLDGTASSDPDGKLVSCSWERISGPEPGKLSALAPGKAIVTGLTLPGKYTYLIKVVDDRAEWSTDTVVVTLSTGTAVNIPPVAKAGKDITVTLGQPVTLDGSGSKDADGSIAAFQWSEISGPSISGISVINTRSATVQRLQAGDYQFKLQVIDNKGAIATDVVRVNVTSAVTIANLTEAPSPDANIFVQSENNYSAEFFETGHDPVFRTLDITDDQKTTGKPEALIFPNPVNNTFSIRLPFSISGNAMIGIYSIEGKLIKRINSNTLQNLSVAGFSSGMYQVEIISAGHPAAHAHFIKK